MSITADDALMQAAGFQLGQRPVETVAAQFILEPTQNEAKTKEAGRPVFDDVVIVEIRIPGDKDIRRRPATDVDKERFAPQYKAFRAGQDQEAASGTPLSAWPLVTRGQAETARYAGVRTVEQLSALSDANVADVGSGWVALRQKARDWLQSAKDGALVSRLREELTERDRRIGTMESMLAALNAAVERMQNEKGISVVRIPVPTEAAEAAPKKRRTRKTTEATG